MGYLSPVLSIRPGHSAFTILVAASGEECLKAILEYIFAQQQLM
jgi:hypothetical protein